MANARRPVPQKGQIWIYIPQENPEPGSTLRLSNGPRSPVGLEYIRHLFEDLPLEPVRYHFALILGDFRPSGGRRRPNWFPCLIVSLSCLPLYLFNPIFGR